MAKNEWQRKGKYGSWIIRFRFSDEARGESFFNTEFTLISFQPGMISFRPEGGIEKALKIGKKVFINREWVHPRGEKMVRALWVTITHLEMSGPFLVLQYS